ncbi:hypothetical protein FHT97_006194 [Rhizobium sp. BK399]|nr:hypothetical protein [Rhizobium sp. BK181]MBB3545424.1 hypothetical protein [Rhizobium sp. BK399]
MEFAITHQRSHCRMPLLWWWPAYGSTRARVRTPEQAFGKIEIGLPLPKVKGQQLALDLH